MQYRNLFCLFSLSLLLPPAWGCRLSESPHNVYQRQGNGVVYLQPEEENNLSLPEVNFKRLRRLPNSLINPATQDEWDREPPLTDLTTDHVHNGYLLTKTRSDFKEEDGLQVFESAGPLILMDYHVPGETEAHLGDSPHYKKWYARDDRYVYAFDGAQLWRYPTPNPKALRVKWQTTYSGYGYWVDYRIAQLDGALMEDGSFIATGIPRDPSVKTAYVKTDGTFDIGKTAVRWRKVLSPDGEWGRWQTIPNVDPSQFHLVNDRIAQYKNRLYIARLSPFGEDQLETLELDSATPFLNRKINAGKEHGYFMRDSQQGQGIQILSINGPLKVTERFAYDNRYVYTWIGSQLYRTASPCPDKTHTLNRNVRYTNNKDIIIITQAQECQKSRR
ncbi:hypothetical protein CB463_18430 [Salmonella enterica subsp. enterica serovar Chester]|nr:hypothetical protein [Salmonella enterica subsp. enterica serovar Chester]